MRVIIEEDEGPYGAMIVLAAKPNQKHVHWTEYVFRLCMSYRQLNAVTRPFNFGMPRCDDETQRIGRAEVCITSDLDAGYWQIPIHKKSREKTGFYVPDGKRHWLHLPMGIKNAATFFVCTMLQLRKEWHEAFGEDMEQSKLGREALQYVSELYKKLAPGEYDWEKADMAIDRLIRDDDPGTALIVDDLLTFAVHTVVLLA